MLTESDVELICNRMQEIVNLDMPFRRTEATNEEAIRVFAERGFADKVKLLETSGQIYSDYYTLGDTADYYYGPLVPSAGYLKVFGLEPYHDGMLLRVPDWNNPTILAEKVDMPKTYEMFAEKTRWDIIMRLSNAGDVNKAILKGHASELIQVSEALQEKKIVQIAEEIDARFHDPEPPIRLVLITGPSSSGKTTFSGKLANMLKTKQHKNPLLVACDVYRPAAIQQLHVVGESVGVPVYSEPDNKNVVEIAQNAIREAKQKNYL